MHCTQKVKVCGLQLTKKSKTDKSISGNESNTISLETNSSSGVISDISDLVHAAQTYNSGNVLHYKPWETNEKNSCRSTFNQSRIKSNLFLCSNEDQDKNVSKPTYYKNYRSFTPSIESLVSCSTNSRYRNSTMSLLSDEKYPALYSLPIKPKSRHKLGSFASLRSDLLSRIFQFLNVSELCCSARVCKHWYSVVWNQNMWYKLDMSQCNGNPKIKIHKGLSTILKILSYATYPYCYCLRVIDLRKCQITDDELFNIGNKCPELEIINLTANIQLHNSAVCHMLERCRRITLINLSKCIQITLSEIPSRSYQNTNFFCESVFYNIKDLDLSYCRQVEDSSIRSFAPVFRSLKRLILKQCVMITDNGLGYLVKFNRALKYLDISGCIFITDKGAESIITNLAALRQLSISKCHRITDNSIVSIARSNNRICELIMKGCPSITQKSLRLLANLRFLDLSDNCHLTKQNIIQIVTNNQHTLRYLIINKFDNLSEDFLKELFKVGTRLNYIDIQRCKFVESTILQSSVLSRSIFLRNK